MTVQTDILNPESLDLQMDPADRQISTLTEMENADRQISTTGPLPTFSKPKKGRRGYSPWDDVNLNFDASQSAKASSDKCEDEREPLSPPSPGTPATVVSGLTVRSLRPEVAVVPSMERFSKKYTISEKLGKGAFGEVSLATCTATGTKLAVKQVRTDVAAKFRMFQNEFDIAKRLQHPNIVKVHDIFINDKLCYLVVELCTGGDLVQFVDSQKQESPMTKGRVYIPPNSSTLARLLWQMLHSVRYVHHHSIVHRDIKMDNFLLSSSSHSDVKLIDFGFAKILGKGEVLKTSAGTRGYAAPEVLDGVGYGFPCDAWSVGVCAYLLLTGVFPIAFQDHMTDAELLNVTKGHEINFKYRESLVIPKAGKDIPKMLLQKDPSKRVSPKELLSTNTWLRTAGRGKSAGCCTTT